MEIPLGLQKAIKDNRLVVFVGAGLSYELKNSQGKKLGGWVNLVAHIIEELERKGHDVAYLQPVLSKHDPTAALALIESRIEPPNNELSKDEIYRIVRSFYELSDENEYSLHKKVLKLTNRVITTNYDTAFEEVEPRFRGYKAYKGKDHELRELVENDNNGFLIKLHGCSENTGSMILFPSDYKKLYESKERDALHLLTVLRTIILHKTILFLGFKLDEPQINGIFKEIEYIQGTKDQRHFVVARKESTGNPPDCVGSIVNISIEDFINELIRIKETQTSTDPEKRRLEEQLKAASKKIAELEKQPSYQEELAEKTRLLEREAYKYYIKGVEYSLSNEFSLAAEQYEMATELKPDFHEAFNNWGYALRELAETKQGKERDDLYKQALQKYEKAIDIESDAYEAFYNLGNALQELAKTKEGKEADELYKQAFEKYKNAIDIKPDYHGAFNNWGNALQELAETKEGKERDDLYKQALQKYEKATELKPNDHGVLNNWAIALQALASTKEGKEADRLYKQALQKYEKATEIKPDDHEVLNNWGIALQALAETKEGKEADELYKQALQKFEKASELKPDDHEVLDNWENVLRALAKTKEGKEADRLFIQALEAYERALERYKKATGAVWISVFDHD
jgi:tetratricopeptide (TPR) repeat protein